MPELILYLAWAAIALILAYRQQFFRWLDRPHRAIRPLSLWSVIVAFIINFGAQAGIGYLLLNRIDLGWVQVSCLLGSALLLFVFSGFFLRLMGRWSWRDFGIGVLVYFLAFPLAALLGQILALIFGPFDGEQVAVQEVSKALGEPLLFTAFAFAVVIVAPIVEELLFRGFLQTWLRRYLSRSWAIVIAATVFAGCHYAATQGLLNVQLVPMLWVLGLFLGYLYERQENLAAPIGLHMIFNAIGVAGLAAT